jgi:hypothetical protein
MTLRIADELQLTNHQQGPAAEMLAELAALSEVDTPARTRSITPDPSFLFSPAVAPDTLAEVTGHPRRGEQR